MLQLRDEFNKFWDKIERGENFVLHRMADGELAIMEGRGITGCDGWSSPAKKNKLGHELEEILTQNRDDVYFGISCPCCDLEAHYWFLDHIKNKKNITFSNLFANGNYHTFLDRLPSLQREAVIIANGNGQGKTIPGLNILKYYPVGDNLFEFYENDLPGLIEAVKREFGNREGLLYVLLAGPMSEIIIAALYENNPNNCYIDFGSALDEFIHDRKTRGYMTQGSQNSGKQCIMPDPKIDQADVSVVLNVYKRPENLRLQLAAILAQSLRPIEILLYQDGTGDTSPLPQDILDQCDKVFISPVNVGVWARFDYARRAASGTYVCVFDDDTIPGKNWLANCHFSMLEQKALYGAVGIVLHDPTKYPALPGETPKYLRVGWPGNCNERIEVDIVGHSWFFRREWLEHLFHGTEALQTFKTRGEDMTFSAMLQQHGIPTFVPPHPETDQSLWGSLPEFAERLGHNDVALSLQPGGAENGRKCMELLLRRGFTPLVVSRPGYPAAVWKKIRKKPLPYRLYKSARRYAGIVLRAMGLRR